MAFHLERSPSQPAPTTPARLTIGTEPLRLFKILRLFLPPILRLITPDINTPPTMNAFMDAQPKRNILRNLYQTHKSNERIQLTPTFPPHIQIVLPQLLNKTTSFLSSIAQTKDHRFTRNIHNFYEQKTTFQYQTLSQDLTMSMWRYS
jgi:hypothetical protein